MNKSWLIVIILAITAAVALAYTWQNIPYLNTAIQQSGLIEKITNLKDTVFGGISENPMSIVGAVVALGGTAIAFIKKNLSTIKQGRAVLQQTRTEAQQLIGDTRAQAEEQIKAITGEKDEAVLQVTTLQEQLKEQAETYANINNVLAAKDVELKKLRDQTDGLHEVIKNMKLGDGEIIERIVVA